LPIVPEREPVGGTATDGFVGVFTDTGGVLMDTEGVLTGAVGVFSGAGVVAVTVGALTDTDGGFTETLGGLAGADDGFTVTVGAFTVTAGVLTVTAGVFTVTVACLELVMTGEGSDALSEAETPPTETEAPRLRAAAVEGTAADAAVIATSRPARIVAHVNRVFGLVPSRAIHNS
jgi:hypothetical protein